jgi:dTDP-4-amino-4,6-dideoxygalactose transaminase
MSIRFYNLKEQYEDQADEIQQAINQVAESGQYFANRSVTRFESLVSALYDGASVAGCNSGTSSLVVALLAAQLPKNSVVAVPALTYVATANAVRAAGLYPVCIDIDNHWLMNYDKLNEYLDSYNDKISAVIVVDLYGQGVNIKKFKELCDHYKVKLIVDAAQSFELFYDHYHQIDHCDSLALSFNPLKNLGAMGNAGAVVSKNYNVEILKKYTQQGKFDGDVITPGLNCRMDAVQAAVLNVKYEKFDENIRRKSEISWYYRQQLELLVPMPERNYICTHTNYVFEIAPLEPDKMRLALSVNGIEFASHYDKPLHHYAAFKEFFDYCPEATALAGRCISLPNHWHLTDEEVDKIVHVVKSAL